MCSVNTANITLSSVEILHYNAFVRYHFIFVHKIGPDTKICETVTDFSESPKTCQIEVGNIIMITLHRYKFPP